MSSTWQHIEVTESIRVGGSEPRRAFLVLKNSVENVFPGCISLGQFGARLGEPQIEIDLETELLSSTFETDYHHGRL